METAMAESKKKKMVTAVFRNQVDAERAFDSLRALGYLDSEIDVLMSDKTRSTWYSSKEQREKHDVGSLAVEGVGVGGTVGTVVGAALGAVAAIGTTIALPGIGLIVAGPIAAALAGAGAGAMTGGLVGGLIGLGMNEENAEAYQEVLRQGGAVIGVRPHSDDDAKRIQKLFAEYSGENVLYA
jgi:hypothetical protein